MEEIYKLEKEYTIPIEIFREAYTSFQKKFVIPKHNLFIGIFCVIAAILVVFAEKEPSNALPYVGICVCLAFAAREWYYPRKVRRNICDSFRELGETVYKIGVADEFLDISTVSESEEDEVADEAGNVPEKTRIDRSGEYQILEYDGYFLILPDKSALYILPKKGFTDAELDLLRH